MISRAARACPINLINRLQRFFKVDLQRQPRSELEQLYLADEQKSAALEWKKHVLSKKASEVATISRDTTNSIVPIVSSTFEIAKPKYLALLKSHESDGMKAPMVNVVNYEGKQITFLSAPYKSIAFKTLWKFMLDARPDLIVAPVRPDTALDNFSISKYTAEAADETVNLAVPAYLRQLIRRGSKKLTQDGKLCPEEVFARKFPRICNSSDSGTNLDLALVRSIWQIMKMLSH